MGRTRKNTAIGMVTCGILCSLGCPAPNLLVDYRENGKAPPPIQAFDQLVPQAPYVPGGQVVLSGQVKNWANLTPVDGASVKSYGLQPQAVGTANGNGDYAVEVQAAGIFWVYASKDGYVPTYNRVQMPAGDHVESLYTLSNAQLSQLAQAYGVTLNPACATVLGQIRSPAALGQAGMSNISIVGASYRGPYFLSARGEAQADLGSTSASGQVIFFNVCDVNATTLTDGLDAQIAALDPGFVSRPQLLKLFAGKATRGTVQVLSTPEDPNPNYNDAPPPSPNATDPYVADPIAEPEPVEDLVLVDFASEVYPIFATNSCAACHIRNSAAEDTELFFDAPPEDVYAMLRDGEERVNLNEPAESTILTMPLLENPPNHPNASFESVYSPDYQKLLSWIEQGAPYGTATAPDPVEPTYFDADVFGLLQAYDVDTYPYGRGCANCHNATVQAGDLDLAQSPREVFQALVDRNLYDVNYPDRSSFLRSPYCGPLKCANDPDLPMVHPTEVFASTNDPDYQVIYQWIAQGAFYTQNPEPPPNLPENVNFFDNVQPRFAKRGCVGCHNAQSFGGGLDLTGLPYLVYQRLTNPDFQRVVAGDYAASSLYTKSLATMPDVVHSGGKTIPNEDDDFARYVAGWIADGAPFEEPAPVDFATDILPLFDTDGFGCTLCHNPQLPSGELSLSGTPTEVYNELRNEGDRINLEDPANSSLLTKSFDLYPAVAHGGGKFAMQDHYRAYHLLITWIFEGAQP